MNAESSIDYLDDLGSTLRPGADEGAYRTSGVHATRVWSGTVAGQSWFAYMISMDTEAGVFSLRVTKAPHDERMLVANCWWDAGCDHFLRRFDEGREVPSEVHAALRPVLYNLAQMLSLPSLERQAC